MKGLISILGFLCLLSVGVKLRAHDVITTKLTWNREISRIVTLRCAVCHHPGGRAFSLLTYGDARPWAVAIKEEILSRRMPPWGAVKGFGDFRNDGSLTPEQIEMITNWIEGGVPEGDAKDIAQSDEKAQAWPGKESVAKWPGGIAVNGDFT